MSLCTTIVAMNEYCEKMNNEKGRLVFLYNNYFIRTLKIVYYFEKITFKFIFRTSYHTKYHNRSV